MFVQLPAPESTRGVKRVSVAEVVKVRRVRKIKVHYEPNRWGEMKFVKVFYSPRLEWMPF